MYTQKKKSYMRQGGRRLNPPLPVNEESLGLSKTIIEFTTFYYTKKMNIPTK